MLAIFPYTKFDYNSMPLAGGVHGLAAGEL